MDSLGEIFRLCRLCLVKDQVNIPIFDDPDNVRQISVKISSCLPVKISKDDNLPKKICDSCSDKLDLCYEFWSSTAIAEKKLLSMVEGLQNQISEPPVPKPMLLKKEVARNETELTEPPVPNPILLKKESELFETASSELLAEEEHQLSEPPVPNPILVKAEPGLLADTPFESVERLEEPLAKRPRRSAAIKAQMNIVPESDDEEDDDRNKDDDAVEDLNVELPITKVEADSDDHEDINEVPDTSVDIAEMNIDDAQPGPSGLNKGTTDSTVIELDKDSVDDIENLQELELLDQNPYRGTNALISPLKLPTDIVEVQNKESPKKRGGTYLKNDMFCTKCGVHFITYYDYDKHILSNPTHFSLNCCQCEKTAKGWKELKIHGQSNHGLEEYFAAEKKFNADNPQSTLNYFCTFCGQKETTIQAIEKHCTDKHFKWSLICPLCPVTSQQPQGLFAHFEREHHMINNVDLVCDQCQYHFYDHSAYTFHMTQVHLRDLQSITYQCVLCPKQVTGESEFILHVHEHGNYKVADPPHVKRRMFSGRPMYSVYMKQCFVCSEMVSSRDELNIHLTTEHFTNNQCTVCSENNIGDIFAHLKDKHSYIMHRKRIHGIYNVPNTFDPTKQTRRSDINRQQICKICYGLLDPTMIAKHMENHKTLGSKRIKSHQPFVDTPAEREKYPTCSKCKLKVVGSFIKWHITIHTRERKTLNRKQLNPGTLGLGPVNLRSIKVNPLHMVGDAKQIAPSPKNAKKKKQKKRDGKNQDGGTKICKICYGLVESNVIAEHMKNHEMCGSKHHTSHNPVVDTIPDQKQCSTCSRCHLRVLTTFLKWHLRVHTTEKRNSNQQQLNHQGLNLPSTHLGESRTAYRSRSPARTSRQLNLRDSDLRLPSTHLGQSHSSYRSRAPAETSRQLNSRNKDLSLPSTHLLRHPQTSYRSPSPFETSRRRERQRRSRSRSRDTSRARSELKCTECDRCYDTVENLVNHVKAQHLMTQSVANPFQSFMGGLGAMRMQRPPFIHPHPLFQQRFGNNTSTAAWSGYQGVNDPGRSDRTSYSGGTSRDFGG